MLNKEKKDKNEHSLIDNKWVFTRKPSRIPKNIKRLIELDKGLSNPFILSHYISSSKREESSLEEGGVSKGYDTLLDELFIELDYKHLRGGEYITQDGEVKHHKIIPNVICNQVWWLNSKWVGMVYETKSVKCYLGVPQKQITESITILANQLYGVIEKYNKENKIKYRRAPLLESCVWLSKHIFKMYRTGHYGLLYSRNNGLYVSSRRKCKEKGDNKISPTKEVVVNLIDKLCELDYGIGFRGFKNDNFDKRMMSMFVPKDKLLSLIHDMEEELPLEDEDVARKALVLIRDSDKNIIDETNYPLLWEADVANSKEILTKCNALYKKTALTIDGCPIPDMYLSRMHCESTVDSGGRLFDDGTWCTMSKKYREKVCIDGKRTVTIDLKYLHPSLLYIKKGIDIANFDPYPSIDIDLDKKLIKKFMKFYGKETYNPIRSVVKLGLLILINSKNEAQAIKALNRKIARNFAKGGTVFEDEMEFVGLPRRCGEEVINSIKIHNHRISEYFCTGVSTELMRIDSDIILEALDTLVDKGVCALPLHDSVTLSYDNIDIGVEAIRAGFIKVTGSDLNFKYTIE